MDPERWPIGRIDPERCLFVSPDETSIDSFKLAAALYFCFRHLAAENVGPWRASVAAIEDPLWRAYAHAEASVCRTLAAHPNS